MVQLNRAAGSGICSVEDLKSPALIGDSSSNDSKFGGRTKQQTNDASSSKNTLAAKKLSMQPISDKFSGCVSSNEPDISKVDVIIGEPEPRVSEINV